MKSSNKNNSLIKLRKAREPLYASLWLALFSELGREYALARANR